MRQMAFCWENVIWSDIVLTCFTQGILTPGVLTRRVFERVGHFDARGFDLRREIYPPPNDNFHVHPRPRTVGVIAFQKKLWLIRKIGFLKNYNFFKKTLFLESKNACELHNRNKKCFLENTFQHNKTEKCFLENTFQKYYAHNKAEKCFP